MSDVDERRKGWGRIGGLRAWSRNDRETMVGPAHRGFRHRFEREVDPDGILDPAERAIRTDRAIRAHMLELADKSARARRRAPDVETPAIAETTGADHPAGESGADRAER